MMEPNGPVCHILLVDPGDRAIRVEGNIRGKLQTGRAVQALEAPKTRIQRRYATTGKAHERDTFRIDTRMCGQQTQGAVGIDDDGQRARNRARLEWRLESATTEAVQNERGDAVRW